MFHFPSIYPRYIPKNEVPKVINRQRRIIVSIIFCTTLVLEVIQLVVIPKLTDISLAKQLFSVGNEIAQMSYFFSKFNLIIVAFTFLYFVLFKPNLTQINQNIKHYKKDELIKSIDIIDTNQIISLAVLIFFLEYLAFNTLYLMFFLYRM